MHPCLCTVGCVDIVLVTASHPVPCLFFIINNKFDDNVRLRHRRQHSEEMAFFESTTHDGIGLACHTFQFFACSTCAAARYIRTRVIHRRSEGSIEVYIFAIRLIPKINEEEAENIRLPVSKRSSTSLHSAW